MNHHQKGTQVNYTEPTPKSPATKTGLLSTLRALFRADGSGASSAGLLVVLALAVAALFATLVTGAQAAGYTAGTPLSTGKLTTSVAVNQSTGDIYVLDDGVFV